MRQTQNTKKDNRKSIFVIALLLLLVAVIGFGGYTMSKYISSKQEEGKANVAKWGFTVSTDTTKLFGKNYVAGVVSNTTADAATLSAKATGDYNVVAPGHRGSMSFTIASTAASEVKAKISVVVDTDEENLKDIVLKYKKGGVAGEDYYPVRWTLAKDGTTVENGSNLTLAQLAAKLNAIGETVNAGKSTTIAGKYTISWAWAFENTENADTDYLDTLLGWTASGTTIPTDYGFTVEAGTNTSIAFTLNISVEQVMA